MRYDSESLDAYSDEQKSLLNSIAQMFPEADMTNLVMFCEQNKWKSDLVSEAVFDNQNPLGPNWENASRNPRKKRHPKSHDSSLNHKKTKKSFNRRKRYDNHRVRNSNHHHHHAKGKKERKKAREKRTDGGTKDNHPKQLLIQRPLTTSNVAIGATWAQRAKAPKPPPRPPVPKAPIPSESPATDRSTLPSADRFSQKENEAIGANVSVDPELIAPPGLGPSVWTQINQPEEPIEEEPNSNLQTADKFEQPDFFHEPQEFQTQAPNFEQPEEKTLFTAVTEHTNPSRYQQEHDVRSSASQYSRAIDKEQPFLQENERGMVFGPGPENTEFRGLTETAAAFPSNDQRVMSFGDVPMRRTEHARPANYPVDSRSRPHSDHEPGVMQFGNSESNGFISSATQTTFNSGGVYMPHEAFPQGHYMPHPEVNRKQPQQPQHRANFDNVSLPPLDARQMNDSAVYQFGVDFLEEERKLQEERTGTTNRRIETRPPQANYRVQHHDIPAEINPRAQIMPIRHPPREPPKPSHRMENQFEERKSNQLEMEDTRNQGRLINHLEAKRTAPRDPTTGVPADLPGRPDFGSREPFFSESKHVNQVQYQNHSYIPPHTTTTFKKPPVPTGFKDTGYVPSHGVEVQNQALEESPIQDYKQAPHNPNVNYIQTTQSTPSLAYPTTTTHYTALPYQITTATNYQTTHWPHAAVQSYHPPRHAVPTGYAAAAPSAQPPVLYSSTGAYNKSQNMSLAQSQHFIYR